MSRTRLCATTLCLGLVAPSCADVSSVGDHGGADETGGGGNADGAESASDTGADDGDADGASGGSEDGGAKFDVGSAETGGADDGGDPDDPCEAVKQLGSNEGCEFWAVDLPNTNVGQAGVPAPADQQFALVVANASSEHEAEVGIYSGDATDPIEMIMIAPEGTRQISLPSQSIDPTQSSDDGVAFRIESQIPITAYQFNPLDNSVKVYSNDATILFPTHVLAEDYVAISEDATSKGATFVSVVAIEDDTQVEVFPTTALAIGGPPVATLDRGEVFTVVSELDDGTLMNAGNLSGSRIVASAPVAAFSGNVSAPVTTEDRICCADHMEHQLVPLHAWGSAYVAAAPPSGVGPAADPARYRITAAYDDTQLTYDPAPPPGAPAVINAYETVTFMTDASFSVTSSDASRPFALTQFLVSGFLVTLPDLNLRVGDPSMIVMPPVEQLQTRYVFVVPMAYAENFVTIVAPQGATVTIDGNAVAPDEFASLATLGGTDYAYAWVPVAAGPHLVEGSDPVAVISVGYDTDVSYGFVAGSGFEIISEPPPPPPP